MKKANALLSESSPYLLQHAYNPVNWVPWTDDIFEQATAANKLVLISVGYSACHWCHVMEHESFEDEEVAKVMNAHFICVKVDREERPDVDQLYMTAVQIMTQRGGWPLNCFTLPDGRPIYGGTYFPKEQWINILKSLQHLFENNLQKAHDYATELYEGVKNSELIEIPQEENFQKDKVVELITRWKKQMDSMEGGNARAPKFPLPNNLSFLLQYGLKYKDETVLKHTELTLDKMAMGGIYDQVGGGFCRYSVDMLWKVPHFEKMLYDNAQLISVYSNAYKVFRKPLYKRIVEQTIEWLQREMANKEGAFYAALDADSEGIEGKFYCWTMEEYKEALGDEFEFVKDLYSINSRGYWEHNNYIPLRSKTDKEMMHLYQLTEAQLEEKIRKINTILLDERSHRVRPGTDDKLLTSWNAMLATGLCDAYTAFGEKEYLHLASKIVRWIDQFQLNDQEFLYRTRKNGISKIEGFLEDYAAVSEAFLRYYEVSGEEKYALLAAKLIQYTIENFQHENSKMFYFTPKHSTLIARKMDINDNVIPASNSIMAHNLWKAGHLFENNTWTEIAVQQLKNVYDGMEMYGSGYSNWAILLLFQLENYYEVLCPSQDRLDSEIAAKYLPNIVIAYPSKHIPFGKFKAESYYVCSKETGCLPPMNTIEDVLDIIT